LLRPSRRAASVSRGGQGASSPALSPSPAGCMLCSHTVYHNHNHKPKNILTNNVPVVFMARYIMVLRGATSLRGALEGVGPEN